MRLKKRGMYLCTPMCTPLLSRSRIWLAMAAPTTPPTVSKPCATTPPRMRRRGIVFAGVAFVDESSKDVIWQSDRQMSVGAALFEIAKLAGHNIGEIGLFNECGPIGASDDIDDAVVRVVFNQ